MFLVERQSYGFLLGCVKICKALFFYTCSILKVYRIFEETLILFLNSI